MGVGDPVTHLPSTSVRHTEIRYDLSYNHSDMTVPRVRTLKECSRH